MPHIKKTGAVMVLVGGIISLFMCACSSLGSSSGPPDGYLATNQVSVSFIQFTEQHNRLNGHMQGIGETNDVPPQIKPYNYAFTGIHDGSAITITFSVLWTSTSFSGTINGDTITLDLPQSDGHLQQETFKAASIQQYNQAVDALQKWVAQRDQQYYNAQATAGAMQVTAIAQQNEQKAVINANAALKNDLSTLKSDASTLSTFSTSTTLGAYARDWQTMQNDYTKEQNDAAKGCGDGNYNHGTVQYDAGSVDYDYGSIQYDDGSLNYDKSTYTSELSTVQNDVQKVNTDWTGLQNAVKANSMGTPASAYTQTDIDTAQTNAQSAENTAQTTWTSAQTSTGTYDSEASDLKKKADAIPGGMGCS